MKSSIKGLVVILVIVMSFVLVQVVWADEITVAGTIERIGTGSIDVANEQVYTFYPIPFNSLEAANISLAVDDWVTITAYVVAFPNKTTKYIAHSITVGDATYDWHPNVPKAGTTDLDSARAVSYDDDDCVCNGDCICDDNCPEDCPDCPCNCLCECICDGTGPNGPKGPKN